MSAMGATDSTVAGPGRHDTNGSHDNGGIDADTSRDGVRDIQDRMSRIRQHIEDDVDGIVQNAIELTDWKHYVRAFPLGSIATAMAVGFLAVPRRTEVVRPDADQIAKLAATNRLVVTNQSEQPKRPGLASTALSLLGTAALRGAVGYVTTNLGSIVGTQAAHDHPDHGPCPVDPSSPVEHER